MTWAAWAETSPSTRSLVAASMATWPEMKTNPPDSTTGE